MSLIAVTGVKGSPGTTTAAITLAAVWPTRPLLVDCDPAGGDVAFRLPVGPAVDEVSEAGLLALAAELRHGPGQPVWSHVRKAAGGLEFLAGLEGSEQAVAIGVGWAAIADELTRVNASDDVDVLADCGRLTADSPASPVLELADLVVVVTRARVEMLLHLRRELRRIGAIRPGPLAVLVVADLRETTAVRDTQQAIQTAGLPDSIPVLGPLVPDSGRLPWAGRGGIGAGLLVRSARALSPQLKALTARARIPEPAHGR